MGHFIPPCLLQVIARPIFWSLFWYKDNDTANNTSSTVYIIRYMLFSSSKIQGRRYSHIRPLRDLPWTDCQGGGRNHRLGWSRWTGEWRRRRAAWPAERGWNSAYAVLLWCAVTQVLFNNGGVLHCTIFKEKSMRMPRWTNIHVRMRYHITFIVVRHISDSSNTMQGLV